LFQAVYRASLNPDGYPDDQVSISDYEKVIFRWGFKPGQPKKMLSIGSVESE
jgi:hypothetical protein